MSAVSGKEFRKRYPWYELYRGAKRRCTDPKHKSYKYCGLLGIKFNLTMFEVFVLSLRDGVHEMKQPSLDRKNANDHYHFENCRVIEKSINERLPHNKNLAAQWEN